MSDNILNVEIRRSSIWLYPYEISKYHPKLRIVTGTCPKLDKSLSVYNYMTHKYVMIIDVYDKSSKTLKVPRGYGINNLLQILRYEKIDFRITDNSHKYIEIRGSIDIRMNKDIVPLNKWQEQAIRFLSEESSDKTDLPQKLLTLDTGFGKTFCTIYSVTKYINMPTMIISANLSKQWYNEISSMTDARKNELYIIKGSDSIKKLLKKRNDRICFYLASTRTLTSYMETYGCDKLNQFLESMGIGVVVFDEIHNQISSNMYIDTNSDTFLKIYLTATPGRSNVDEDIVFKRLFRDIRSFGYQTHFIKTYYNIRLIDYDTQSNQIVQESCMTPKGFSGFKYFNYIVSNVKRRLYIFGLMKLFSERIIEADRDAKILIFLPGLEHINVYEKLMAKSSNFSVGNYTSQINDVHEKEYQKSKNIIFTTIGSGSTGLDLKNLRAVFLFSPLSSRILSRQLLGRLRFIEGKSVYLYDFIDRSIDHMKYQRDKRMQVFGPRSNKIEEVFCSYNEVKREMLDKYNIEI